MSFSSWYAWIATKVQPFFQASTTSHMHRQHNITLSIILRITEAPEDDPQGLDGSDSLSTICQQAAQNITDTTDRLPDHVQVLRQRSDHDPLPRLARIPIPHQINTYRISLNIHAALMEHALTHHPEHLNRGTFVHPILGMVSLITHGNTSWRAGLLQPTQPVNRHTRIPSHPCRSGQAE